MSTGEEVIAKDNEHQPKPPRLFAWLASLATLSVMLANLFLPRGSNPCLRHVGVVVLLLAGVFIFVPFYLLARHGETKNGQTYMQASVVRVRPVVAALGGRPVRGPGSCILLLASCAGREVLSRTIWRALPGVSPAGATLQYRFGRNTPFARG